jgi:hypothetical protein
MLRAIVIATAIGLAGPACAQVNIGVDSPELRILVAPSSSSQNKVITSGVKDVHEPGGANLDSPELRDSAVPSYGLLKIISGDVERVYGPGGEILDSSEFRDLAVPADGKVKIISGAVEHVYGSGGEILDSPELRAKNQRAKRQRSEERPAGPPEQQRLSLQQSRPSREPDSWWSDDAARYQPPTSWWNNAYTPPKSAAEAVRPAQWREPDSWWSNDAARYQPPISWWNNNGYAPPKSAWSQ